jgi:hypothetical protein
MAIYHSSYFPFKTLTILGIFPFTISNWLMNPLFSSKSKLATNPQDDFGGIGLLIYFVP